jgi:hypothetical protein
MIASERQRPAHEGPGEGQIVLAGSNVSENSLPVNYRDRCPMICAGDNSCTRNCPTPTPWPTNVVDAIDCDGSRCIPDRRSCPGECVQVVEVAS